MIYLSGHIRLGLDGIGFLCTPNSEKSPPPDRVWAADTGRFTAPGRYTDERYLSWLKRKSPALCLFATAPDVVGDHAATLELSKPMFAPIRAAGYKVALVVQDGWGGEIPWTDFDALFIGGTTTFKLGPRVPCIVREAKRHGKWVHMGRVNSYGRLRMAQAIGCDSVDGTYLKFGPDTNAPKLARWIKRIFDQHHLRF